MADELAERGSESSSLRGTSAERHRPSSCNRIQILIGLCSNSERSRQPSAITCRRSQLPHLNLPSTLLYNLLQTYKARVCTSPPLFVRLRSPPLASALQCSASLLLLRLLPELRLQLASRSHNRRARCWLPFFCFIKTAHRSNSKGKHDAERRAAQGVRSKQASPATLLKLPPTFLLTICACAGLLRRLQDRRRTEGYDARARKPRLLLCARKIDRQGDRLVRTVPSPEGQGPPRPCTPTLPPPHRGTDLFGLGVPNCKIVADWFAENTGLPVFVPDLLEGESGLSKFWGASSRSDFE